MTKPQTIRQFFKQFPDDETCLQHLFDIRFGQGHECPKCERESNWYRIKAERAYSCQWCGHHLHPTVGTPFERSRTPLQLWFYAIFLFTTTRHGVSAKELERQLGVTYKTAWRMGHEIRKHMAEIDGENPLGGAGKAVEVDETFVGGVDKRGKGGRGGDPARGKTILFGMLERDGEIMTQVVPNRKRASLYPLITGAVREGTQVHTDEYRTYNTVGSLGYGHRTVNHAKGEYASPDGRGVNGLESYWSQLKRGINGTHISVSGKHLGKYAKEFEYRFNRRQRPASMLDELLSTFRPSN